VDRGVTLENAKSRRKTMALSACSLQTVKVTFASLLTVPTKEKMHIATETLTVDLRTVAFGENVNESSLVVNGVDEMETVPLVVAHGHGVDVNVNNLIHNLKRTQANFVVLMCIKRLINKEERCRSNILFCTWLTGTKLCALLLRSCCTFIILNYFVMAEASE